MEEVHHAITQIGYGLAYPTVFSTKSWQDNSTLVKECVKARCDWWTHPENKCLNKGTKLPDNYNCMKTRKSNPGVLYPGNGGTKCSASQNQETCAYPSCDCIEWYHQVELQFKSKILISPQRFLFIAPLILMPHFFYISLDCIALCWTNTRLDLWN